MSKPRQKHIMRFTVLGNNEVREAHHTRLRTALGHARNLIQRGFNAVEVWARQADRNKAGKRLL